MDVSILDQIKLRFRNGAVCPHCGSNAVNKFGFSRESSATGVKSAEKLSTCIRKHSSAGLIIKINGRTS